MELREFWPDDDESVAAYVDVENAVEAVDAPEQHPMTVGRMTAWLRHGWDGEPPRLGVTQQAFIKVPDADALVKST